MKRILIVENHHSTLMRLAQIARRIIGDTQIYTVDNVSEAYRLSMEYTIDLFVVDVVLEPASPGDTSGMKFVDRIRQIEKYYFVPVVMISALEDAGYYCYSKLHCYDYIEKPFDEERVYQAMEKCLKYQT